MLILPTHSVFHDPVTKVYEYVLLLSCLVNLNGVIDECLMKVEQYDHSLEID